MVQNSIKWVQNNETNFELIGWGGVDWLWWGASMSSAPHLVFINRGDRGAVQNFLKVVQNGTKWVQNNEPKFELIGRGGVLACCQHPNLHLSIRGEGGRYKIFYLWYKTVQNEYKMMRPVWWLFDNLGVLACRQHPLTIFKIFPRGCRYKIFYWRYKTVQNEYKTPSIFSTSILGGWGADDMDLRIGTGSDTVLVFICS